MIGLPQTLFSAKSELNRYKDKCHSTTRHEDTEEGQKYSSTLSLPSALEVGGLLKPRSGRFTPKNRAPFLITQ
jgi:hypothetical protein